ncbi:MAG TPA: hypothetical protein VF680_04180 [Allosphingosinicella sp.]|jgi:hypothetical protein
MTLRLILTAATAFAMIAPAPAGAFENPAKIKVTERSKGGAVLIRLPVQRAPIALQFSKNGSSGFLSRVYMIKVKPGAATDFTWAAESWGPGRYRLDSIWQQGHWSACLEQGTFEVDVKAGKIAYVGTLDTGQLLASLQEQVVEQGKVIQTGSSYFQSHGKTRVPPLGDRDEAGLAAARSFAETSMNGSGERVELASTREVSFATSGAGKAIKVCG